MALSNNDTDHAAQAGSHISNTVTPSLGLFNDYLLDFHTTAQSLTSTLYGELEAIFSRINIYDISPSHLDKPLKTTSRPISKPHHPTYIEPAYHWLLANIHNPYPPKELRVNIARKAKSDVKSVEAWFVDARSRIGWNSLRKTHFGNRRADIVDAATRFFVQTDEKRPLSPTLEFEFAQMENSAKSLYADKFVETTLAAKLDVAVRDLTLEMKMQAKMHAREELKRQKAASSYPSPLHSPDRSPEPEKCPPLAQEIDSVTTPLDALTGTGRKRRSSSSEFNNDAPSKRARAGSLLPSTTCLPSPTPSSHESLRSASPPGSSSDPILLPTISRKRGLSESHEQGASKRLPVCDPLPITPSTLFDWKTSNLDNWFNTQFDISTPVNVDLLDDTQGLDLDIYSYSAAEANTSSSSTKSQSEASSTLKCAEVVAHLVRNDVSSGGVDISANNFNYNEYLDDCEQFLFAFQDFAHSAGTLPALQRPLLDFSVLSDSSSVSDHSVHNSFLATTAAHATNFSPNTNIDNWDLSTFGQFETPFNATNLAYNVSLHTDLFSEINTQRGNAVVPMPDQEGSVEIQLRLATMKEEMRRLEECIAKTS